MKRNEFIRKSILGMIGLSLSVAISDSSPSSIVESSTCRTIKFKISNELLQDVFAFEMFIEKLIAPQENVVSILVGWEDDDFIKDLHTCEISLR